MLCAFRGYFTFCVYLPFIPAVLVMAIQCPMDYRPYTCSSAACSCLLVSTETEADFPLALTTCSDSSDGGHLALIGEDYDRQIIQRYVEVLAGDSSNLYWVGYRYDSSVAAVDVNGQPALSVLTNTSNFDPSTPAPSTDSCIAIGGDGLFRNVPCDTALQYICSVDYTGECTWICLCQCYKVCACIYRQS